MRALQYSTDKQGHKVVLIPVKKWETIQQKLDLLNSKRLFIEGIVEAFWEIKLHMTGKKKLQSAKDFLNEI